MNVDSVHMGRIPPDLFVQCVDAVVTIAADMPLVVLAMVTLLLRWLLYLGEDNCLALFSSEEWFCTTLPQLRLQLNRIAPSSLCACMESFLAHSIRRATERRPKLLDWLDHAHAPAP